MLAHKTLIEPWVTESSTAAVQLNKYVFKIASQATKRQVKKSIEDIYKVKVISVNTISIPKKRKNYGKTPGWKSAFKKAVVTLKAGDSIEIFKGA